MAGKKQTSKQKRQQQLPKRKQRDQQPGGTLARAKLPLKAMHRLEDAWELLRNGRLLAAEESLKKLDERHYNHPEIVEALVFLYQSTQDRQACSHAAARLARLRPRDPDANLVFAQALMFCDRVASSLTHYQEFVCRWPDHPHVAKARSAIELLTSEVENRLQVCCFPAGKELECLMLHEESLSLLRDSDFLQCAKKCQQLIELAPSFASPRNNLVTVFFHAGHAADAIAVAEETSQRFPDNRFAEAALAKLYFLTGRGDEVEAIADRLVANPPSQQDPLVATLELLCYLGRVEDIVKLAESVSADVVVDRIASASVQHFLAFAKCRLGDQRAALNAWKQCLKLYPGFPHARQIIDDLNAGTGHAPWADSIDKWIPKESLDKIIGNISGSKQFSLAKYPFLKSLIPALLDRGDPVGRELALRLAKLDGSASMIDALKAFAFGSRGPDSMRMDALQYLEQKQAINAGPHRIYSRGKWIESQLQSFEIYSDPPNSNSPAVVLEHIETGIDALKAGDFDVAESHFKKAIEIEPGNCSAIYNQVVVWLRRDGASGKKRALLRLEQLHHDSPEYLFAPIGIAQIEAMNGDTKAAKQWLVPIHKAKRLHVSEAIALYTMQIQISLAEQDLDTAKTYYELLQTIADDDDQSVASLGRRIAEASKPGVSSGLRSVFKSIFR